MACGQAELSVGRCLGIRLGVTGAKTGPTCGTPTGDGRPAVGSAKTALRPGSLIGGLSNARKMKLPPHATELASDAASRNAIPH